MDIANAILLTYILLDYSDSDNIFLTIGTSDSSIAGVYSFKVKAEILSNPLILESVFIV